MNRHLPCFRSQWVALGIHQHQMVQAHVFHYPGDRPNIQGSQWFYQNNANPVQGIRRCQILNNCHELTTLILIEDP
jgi:hypothetical protein